MKNIIATPFNSRDLLHGFFTFAVPAVLFVVIDYLPLSSIIEISFGLAPGAFSAAAFVFLLAMIGISIINFLYYYKRRPYIAWGTFFGAITLCFSIFLIMTNDYSRMYS